MKAHVRCKEKTVKGTQCKKNCKPGEDFCAIHDTCEPETNFEPEEKATEKATETKVMKEPKKKPTFNDWLDRWRNLDWLLGPSGFSQYIYRDDVHGIEPKLLLFFHEYHVQPPKEIQGLRTGFFLEGLFKSSPTCIDFFLETTSFRNVKTTGKIPHFVERSPYGEDEEYGFYGEESEIGEMEGLYWNCLGSLKSQCPEKYPLTRFHNIELRRSHWSEDFRTISFGNDGIFILPLFYLTTPPGTLFRKSDLEKQHATHKARSDKFDVTLSRCVFLLQSIEWKGRQQPFFKAIIDGLVSGDSAKVLYCIREWLDVFEPILEDGNWQIYYPDSIEGMSIITKVNKQLTNPDFPIPADIQEKYLFAIRDWTDHLEKFVTYMTQMYIGLLQARVGDEKLAQIAAQKLLRALDRALFEFGLVVNDIYTFARMLKVIYGYRDSSIIIFYAGGGHTERHIEVFKKWNHLTLKAEIPYDIENDAALLVKGNDNWPKMLDQLRAFMSLNKKCYLKPGKDM